MLNLFSADDPPVIEKRGRNSFVPAHPQPHQRRPRAMNLVMAARRNLLGIWTRGDYSDSSGATQVLARQIVLANTPEHVKHVMATRSDNYERKSPQMRRALEYLLGDGLFISDGDTWKQRRPLVVDIVHKNRLPVFGRTMEHVTAEFGDRWAALPAGTVLDGLAEMAELTAEIISRSVFGNDLGREDARDVIEGFSGYQAEVDSTNLPVFLGSDEGHPVKRSRKLDAAVGRVHRVIDRVVSRHLDGEGDHDSMIDALVRVQKKNPGLGLTRDALRNEAATIFMAGHETTAATLTWAWYCLANSPWAERRLREEIRAVCGDRRPSVEDVPRLDYTRAVIDEVLRLYPPVPILSRQARAADRMGDIEVKPGALVLVVPWLLHRSRSHWERPNHFRPERFVEGRPVPYSYAPFAVGPRICAGLAFGQTESILCLASLVQRFEVRVPEGTRVEPVCRLTLRPKGGLPITVRAR